MCTAKGSRPAAALHSSRIALALTGHLAALKHSQASSTWLQPPTHVLGLGFQEFYIHHLIKTYCNLTGSIFIIPIKKMRKMRLRSPDHLPLTRLSLENLCVGEERGGAALLNLGSQAGLGSSSCFQDPLGGGHCLLPDLSLEAHPSWPLIPGHNLLSESMPGPCSAQTPLCSHSPWSRLSALCFSFSPLRPLPTALIHSSLYFSPESLSCLSICPCLSLC